MCNHYVNIKGKEFKKRLFLHFLNFYNENEDEQRSIDDAKNETLIDYQCDYCKTNSNLYICLHCSKPYCLQHICTNQLILNGKTCDIYCLACKLYLYPREISQVGNIDHILTDIAESWLQIKGRYNKWWIGNHVACGLKNFGNTCYFNSLIINLLHLETFTKKLQNHQLSASCIQNSLKNLVNEYQINKNHCQYIEPKELWKSIKENGIFGHYQEKNMEDSYTLLLDILNSLHQDILQEFLIQSTSCIECKHCKIKKTLNKSDEYTIHLNTSSSSIDIKYDLDYKKEEVAIDINELLNEYFKNELLNDYQCENCQQFQTCFKTIHIDTSSKVLILYINRFKKVKLNTNCTGTIKSHQKVILHDEIIFNGCTYRLSGLLYHDGGGSAGHYMSIIRTKKDSSYIWFSDKHTKELKSINDLDLDVHLLFFLRV